MRRKIALISSSFPPCGGGGITSAHYNLYLALKNKGFTVKVYTFGDHDIRPDFERDIIRHGTPHSIIRAIRFLNRIYFRLADKSKGAYQLSDILESAIGSLKINSSLKSFLPDILILPDHGCPGLFIKKDKGCQAILISHHNPARFLNEPLLGDHSEKDAQLAIRLEDIALKKIDKVICPSTYMEEVFKKTYHYTGPTSVIPNLVDDKLLNSIAVTDLRKDLDLSDEAVLIYIPSAGNRFKGSRFVFEIIRRLSEKMQGPIGFYLSGNLSEELKYELSFLPEKVKIFSPGYLPYSENISMVKSCSFAISPTLIENFGMSILEACFCELPVVTFDVGGNREIIVHGENGFLVQYLDIEDMIACAEKLLDKSMRDAMRIKAGSLSNEKFNYNKIVEQYIKLIDDRKDERASPR